MATKQKVVDFHVCDACEKEAEVAVCAHCQKEICGDCGWHIKCRSFGFLRAIGGVVCDTCREHLARLLLAFGLADHIGRDL